MAICGFDDALLGRGVSYSPPLPVEGSVEVDLPVEIVWRRFADVERWREWNGCFARAWIRGGGELAEGSELVLVFNPIRRWLPYRLPGPVKVVELEPGRRVTWEADTLGFHARHSYVFEQLGPERCAFGSFEVAEGPAFRATRSFWVAHFNFVCRESLAGARSLALEA
jgi:polyketide cyclase/dehydrase/lipid transport protein